MDKCTAILISLCTWQAACAAEPTNVSAADGGEPAPSYAELYDTYFAQGTPGHCATVGCHADPGHNVWLCGPDADTCYQGMTAMGLIDADHPEKSVLGDPKRSPLTWINASGGTMPLDAQGPNDDAKAAIEAWLAHGAPRE